MGLFDFLDKKNADKSADEDSKVKDVDAGAPEPEDDFSGKSIAEIAESLKQAKESGEPEAMQKLLSVLEKLSAKSEKAVVTESLNWNEENHEAILSDPKKLQSAMKEIVVEAIVDKLSQILEQRDQDLMSKFHGMLQGSKSVDLFYERHKDLEPYKDFVGFVAEQLRTSNAKMPQAKFDALVAKVVREKLKLSGEAPAVPNVGTSSRQAIDGEQTKSEALFDEFFGKRSKR